MTDGKTKLKFVIVEDNSQTLQYLHKVVSGCPEFGEIVCATTLSEAERVTEENYDVLLVDLHLEDETSFNLIRREADRGIGRILVVSIFADVENTVRAIEAGASGYVLKTEPEEMLRSSILSILDGHCPVSPAIAGHLLSRFRAPQADLPEALEDPNALSPREKQVLHSLALGKRYKEVASSLGISVNTVNSYTKSLYKKLNANSRAEAVNIAYHQSKDKTDPYD